MSDARQSSYRGPGIYRHFRGGEYEVLGIAVREETKLKHDEAPLECSWCKRQYRPGEPPDEACGTADRSVYGCQIVDKGKTDDGVLVVIYRSVDHDSRSKVDFWERTLESFNEMVPCYGDDDCAMRSCSCAKTKGKQPRFVLVGPLNQVVDEERAEHQGLREVPKEAINHHPV